MRTSFTITGPLFASSRPDNEANIINREISKHAPLVNVTEPEMFPVVSPNENDVIVLIRYNFISSANFKALMFPTWYNVSLACQPGTSRSLHTPNMFVANLCNFYGVFPFRRFATSQAIIHSCN